MVAPAAGTASGPLVTWLHPTQDTSFPAAARICAARCAQLCTKSQCVALRDAGLVTGTTPYWTPEASDNDGSHW